MKKGRVSTNTETIKSPSKYWKFSENRRESQADLTAQIFPNMSQEKQVFNTLTLDKTSCEGALQRSLEMVNIDSAGMNLRNHNKKFSEDRAFLSTQEQGECQQTTFSYAREPSLGLVSKN